MKIFLNIFNVLFIFERETECEQGREREGDTESEAGSRLQAVSTERNAEVEAMNCKIVI